MVRRWYFLMSNRHLDSIRLISYVIIAFLLSMVSPWWIIAVIGTYIGFCAKTCKKAIFESIFTLSLTWFIMIFNNLFIQDYIIVEKMKAFLGLNSFTLIMVTLMIPILIGLLSSIFGYELKKAVRYDK